MSDCRFQKGTEIVGHTPSLPLSSDGERGFPRLFDYLTSSPDGVYWQPKDSATLGDVRHSDFTPHHGTPSSVSCIFSIVFW